VHPATRLWGALLCLGVGEELLFSFSYGEAEAGRRKTFYVRSRDELATQPSAPLLFSVEVKRDVDGKAWF